MMQVRVKPKRSQIKFEFIFIGLVCFFTIGLFVFKTLPTHGEFRVWFFDVGQGDATLLISPKGERLLIDGGPDQSVLSKLGTILPPWDRRIDAVLLTHPDADHMLGLISVLEFYDVQQVYVSGEEAQNAFFKAWSKRLQEEQATVIKLKQGEEFKFGGLDVHVLWPRADREDFSRNNQSIVLDVHYGDTSILLTGDLEEEGETELLAIVKPIDVLKAGHHGSLSSSSYAFVQKTKSDFSIISAGLDNRYGHPHPTVLERLKDVGSRIFRTDLDGDILLSSFGGEPVVKEKPLPF